MKVVEKASSTPPSKGSTMTKQETATVTGARLSRLLRGSWVPVGLILGSVTLLAHDAAQPVQALNAAASVALDSDGDGLVDLVERQLGTLINVADTDGDGIGDGEEVARGSSPRLAHSAPRQRAIDVGIVVHSRESMLHMQLLIYVADGDLRGKNLVVNAFAGEEGRVVQIPTDVLVRTGGLTSFDAGYGSDGDSAGEIFVLDLPIRPRIVYTSGSLSLSASVAAPGTGQPGTAATLDLVNIDGTICQRVDGSRILAASNLKDPDPSGGGLSGTYDASGGVQGYGSIFQPIYNPGANPGGGARTGSGNSNPSTAVPGQVCIQQTETVGVSGGTVVQEVVSAICFDGWDGFCSPSCLGSVGQRIRTLDPIIYSGG